MNKALVIADDLSGAAEIAGIGQRYGLPARIDRQRLRSVESGLTVVDTDTRSLPPDDAEKTVARKVRDLRRQDFDLIFKKTDSVLRGPIAAEIRALLDHFDLPGAMLVPQNPSRGRTIENGRYLIDGVPLDQTAFAGDPEHPATSADVVTLPGVGHIPVCDARNAGEVRQWAAKARGGAVLPAGGADFFEAILQDRGLSATRAFEDRLPAGPTLFVCGSASAYSRELMASARSRGVAVLPIPANVAAIAAAFRETSRVMIAIDRPLDRTPGAAQRLQQELTDNVAKILKKQTVANLLLEGGSTASAVCRHMGWNALEVCGELAVGVVRLRAAGSQDLVIKPGSYPWPDAVWKEN